MGDVPVDCPNPTRWLAVAAGTEDPDVSAKLTEHAATCAVCAKELREAIAILSDEGDAVEDRFLASLESSRPDRQRELAQRLCGPTPASRDDVRSSRKGSGFSWRICAVLAAAAIGTAAAVFLIWRGPAPQSSAVNEVRAPEPTAATQVPAHSGSVKTSSEAAPRPEAMLASVLLEPGTTRGLERSPVLRVTSSTQFAAVTLLFLDAPPRKLSVKLLDGGDRALWTEELQLTSRDVTRRQVTVKIPVNGLTAADYRIVADRVTSGGAEGVSDYRFRVVR